MSMLLQLISAFWQVGIVAFGGGLSTLPLIYYQIVTKTGWLTDAQFNQVLALSQVTPGPIAINAATFVGYQQAGVLGSLVSTLAIAAAPVGVLIIVTAILQKCSAEKSKKFTSMLRPLVSGLLTLSILSPLKATIDNGVIAIAMFAAGILLIRFNKIVRENPAAMLFIFGAAGALLLA